PAVRKRRTAGSSPAARSPPAPGGFDRAAPPCYSTHMRKGVPVSPGVAVARAYCVDEVLARREPNYLDVAALSDEVSRFDRACAPAAKELDAIVARVREQVGDEAASFFQGHRLLLRAPALITKVKSAILNRHVDAQTALHDVIEEYGELFAQIKD